MMRNKLIALFILLVSADAFSQDCNGLRENEEYRLDKNAGPLQNSRIQDQDGLGTCYANSSSVALQTAMPGNPDVSYLGLAFGYAQVEVAPKNKTKDSAFVYGDGNVKGDELLEGGRVCETINAAKTQKIGGVCLRSDVALENSLFNPATHNSKDSIRIQKSIVASVSEYYDSIKDKFGTTNLKSSEEIAKRTLDFSNYKSAFNDMIKSNQDRFGKENCLKPDLTNAQTVVKNSELRIYSYFKNKNGSANSSKAYDKIKGKPNPDAPLFFYYLGMGSIYEKQTDGQLDVKVSNKMNETLTQNYMKELSSKNPPKDGVSAFRNALLKADDKGRTSAVDRIMAGLSPEDKDLLDKDYRRYVKKDLAECVAKSSFDYYKKPDGMIKDFTNDNCLKNYVGQGKSLSNLAQLLGDANLNNIDALNSFMSNLPNLSYEEAMRAILAPDCTDSKKIRLPQNLTCDSINFNYPIELRNKLVREGAISSTALDSMIRTEETRMKNEIEANYAVQVRALEGSFAGRTDKNSLDEKNTKLQNLEIEKNNRKNRAKRLAEAKMVKQVAGGNEQRYWNEYISSNKNKFSSDAIGLLKNQKQAVPLSLCTRMFNTPSSTALRDGSCEQDSADNNYQSVGGYHSVSAIGVRCQRGKLNYLIQNSWGDWAGIKSAKNPDGSEHFESEFGKAWMSEDELGGNLFDYQKISK